MGARQPAPHAFTIVMLLTFIGKIDPLIVSLVADRHYGILTCLDFFHLPKKHAPIYGDTLIGRTQILARPVGYFSLRNPGHHVLSIDIIYNMLTVLVPR